MIDLHKLSIFHVVAQAGCFSAAAEQLYMTQSAVSQHIKDLELGLGQQLFIRSHRGVTLTPVGDLLADYSSEIFALVAKAETALTDVAHLTTGKLSIGSTQGVSSYLLPDWLLSFRAKYPHLMLALHTDVTSQVVADVLAHRIDIGIVEGELEDYATPRLASYCFQQFEQFVVVGKKHPFWSKTSLLLNDLDHQPFLMREQTSQTRLWLDKLLQTHSVTSHVSAELDNLELMKRALKMGKCIAMLPLYVAKDEIEYDQLRAIPISDKSLIRSVNLIWDNAVPRSPITDAFVGELKPHCSID